jgi:hypothetical protein
MPHACEISEFKWIPCCSLNAEGGSVLADCIEVNVKEGLIDSLTPHYWQRPFEGAQVQQLPDVMIFMRLVLLSNKEHGEKPDILLLLLSIREPFLSSLWSGFCWKCFMIFVEQCNISHVMSCCVLSRRWICMW